MRSWTKWALHNPGRGRAIPPPPPPRERPAPSPERGERSRPSTPHPGDVTPPSRLPGAASPPGPTPAPPAPPAGLAAARTPAPSPAGRCPHPRRPLLRDASRRGVRVDVGGAGPWGPSARARATAAAGGRGRRQAGRGLPARPPRGSGGSHALTVALARRAPRQPPPPRAAPPLATLAGGAGARATGPPASTLRTRPIPPLIVSPPNASPNEKITEPPGEGGGEREGSLTHLPWSSPPVV